MTYTVHGITWNIREDGRFIAEASVPGKGEQKFSRWLLLNLLMALDDKDYEGDQHGIV